MIKPSLDHCIWLKNANIAFIYIPKVACTSWKIFLWQMMGYELTEEITYKTVHNSAITELPYVGKMGKDEKVEFMENLNDGRLECCTMIREPKARVLSAYLDKILLHKNPNSLFSKSILPEIREYHKLDMNQRPTLLEFLKWNRYIRKEQKKEMNDHWLPMSEIIGIRGTQKIKQEFVRIWQLSHIHEAEIWFQERLNKKIKFPNSQYLGPRSINNSGNKVNRYFGKDELDLYNEIYEQDEKIYNLLNTQKNNH